LNELIKRAKSLHVKNVWLTSKADNEKAYKLWTRFGFENKKADYQENGL
jgi:ribosomal protein S18 acetylase RimI-like enzyme